MENHNNNDLIEVCYVIFHKNTSENAMKPLRDKAKYGRFRKLHSLTFDDLKAY